jgi:hypothetical protein
MPPNGGVAHLALRSTSSAPSNGGGSGGNFMSVVPSLSP